MQRAEALAAQLPEREAQRRLGSLQQMRGQICQARGDEAGVIQALQAALVCYERAGAGMEAANCHYLLGALHLNGANRDLSPTSAWRNISCAQP